jgi:hypothetical protein
MPSLALPSASRPDAGRSPSTTDAGAGNLTARQSPIFQAQLKRRSPFTDKANADLDAVYERCLKQAVVDTGYELRTVPQRAGHIDAIIEDDIRRCRFVVADLTDGNAGAYWEAGLAEGLRKPVIYLCRAGVETHFDTDHRQTVRWDLAKLDETAARLKAVIRNTLLGEARQED